MGSGAAGSERNAGSGGGGRMSRRSEAVLVAAVLLLALWLRARGLDWGLPHPYHPDEGSILFHSLAFGTGDLNPHWFRWPSLLMYVMFAIYGAYFLIGRVVGLFGAPVDLLRSYLSDLSPFWLMGRWVSVIAGTATVWVTYRLGKRAFGAAAGVVAALFLAVVYLHVRDSHYATPDVAATFLAALSLLAALRACDTERARDLVLSGLLAGLSASAKYPGVLAAAGTGAAFVSLYSRRKVGASALVSAAAAAALGFVVGTPYSVLSFGEFVRDVTRQFTMVSSSGVAQAASSFAGGLKEVFGETVARGASVPLALLGAVGLFWPGTRGRGQRAVLVAYVSAVVVFAVLITVKRSTYLTPALPALTVLAAGALTGVFERLRRSSARAERVSMAAAALALAAIAVVPSVRFGTALASPDTRTLAREWVEREISPGTAVALEEYGPVLNQSEAQLAAMISADDTSIEEWKGPQRMLSELRLEVGLTREPRYLVYGIGHGTPPFRLPGAAEAPDRLVAAVESLGVPFVVVTSKAAPWRAMEGAAPPRSEVHDTFYQWLGEVGVLRRRFVDERPVPPIDRGDGRSFHSPVIEIFDLRNAPEAHGRAAGEGGSDADETTPGRDARSGDAAAGERDLS